MKANTLSSIVIICGLISFALVLYGLRFRNIRGSKLFSAFMISVSVYVVGYGMELASIQLQTMLFWSTVGYLGIYFFPNLFLIFILQFTGREKWITWRNILLIFLFPTLLLIGKLTDGIFHLVYSNTWVDSNGIIPVLGFTRGPIYPFAIYAIIPTLFGLFLLFKRFTTSSPLYRNQATLIAISTIVPIVFFISYMINYQLIPALKFLDYNVFAIPFWEIGLIWAMYRHQLFQLEPIARETLIECMSDGVIVIDSEGRIVDANPTALKIFNWGKTPIGHQAEVVFSKQEDMRAVCQLSGNIEPILIEIQNIKDSVSLFYEVKATPLHDEFKGIIGRLIVIHDITERKKLERELQDLSLVDELTGLCNRRGFNILATQFINMSDRMNLKAAVIYADLDWLKTINDTFGHAEGDQALLDTARLLRNTFRSSDIIARLSGDEFVILAGESNDYSAEGMLDRFNQQLDALNSKNDRSYTLSISLGMAHFNPDKPVTLLGLMDEADKDMYSKKEAKKVIRF